MDAPQTHDRASDLVRWASSLRIEHVSSFHQLDLNTRRFIWKLEWTVTGIGGRVSCLKREGMAAMGSVSVLQKLLDSCKIRRGIFMGYQIGSVSSGM